MSTIVFRVDAGEKVGLGHYFRSVTLAKELRRRKLEIVFIHEESIFWNNNDAFEFEHHNIPFERKEEWIYSFISNSGAEMLYVDGIINFSRHFIDDVKKLSSVVFYQNLSNSRHMADIYILPSIHQENEFFNEFDASTTIFQGLQYAIFNDVIYALEPKSEPEGDLYNIGVIAGGSDPNNVLLKVYELLPDNLLDKYCFTFYYGQNYMHIKSIPTKDMRKGCCFEPYSITDILKNNLLVSAFGVSSYEFMSLGVPIIGIGHQASNAHALKIISEKLNVIYDLGNLNDLTSSKLQESIGYFANNPLELQNQADRAKACIDLEGYIRVANIIQQKLNG